jgi:hypothetical protein
MALFDEFQEIRRSFQAVPFWFWNDDMEPGEIRRQIGEMAAREIGGFFIHARMGRVTPYMSEPWMECVKAAVAEARRRGMEAWIYDEDNWPSGYGGGAICELGDRYLQKYVFCQEIHLEHHGDVIEDLRGDAVLGVYAASRDNGSYCNITRLAPEQIPDGTIIKENVPGDSLLVCTVHVHKMRRYFCPECSVVGYVDVMDPAVIRAFIEHTYETYRKELGDDFGSTVAGFFLDEPNYHEYEWRDTVLRRPWTPALPELYRSLTARDLHDDLPLLFFNCGDFMKVRLGYYRAITQLFVESFTHQIYRWCDEHGVQLTGHYIVEEDLRGTCQCTGNPMEHYQYQHVPGIDHLGKDIDLTDDFWSASRVLCKQVASVVRQLGKERVMCETFAGGGWDFGPQEEKWMGDWMQALGVNMICPHAFHYSLRGYRKRDYPPSLSFQQPWWPHSCHLGKHFGRLGWILTRGERITQVALLHPLNSVRATHRVQDFPWDPDLVQDPFQKITEILLSNQIDFDYLDEQLLQQHGRTERKSLWLGAGEYRVVVVPPLVTISSFTRELLERFVKHGGVVLVTDPRATKVDAEPEPSLEGLWAQCQSLGPWGSDELEQRLVHAIKSAVRGSVSVSTGDRNSRQVVYMHRRAAEGDIYFFASAAKIPFEAQITLVGQRKVSPERWDTVTGRRDPLFGRQGRQGVTFALPFDYGRSHVVVVPRREKRIEASPRSRRRKRTRLLTEGKKVRITIEQPNVLLLDRCRARVEGEDFGELMPVILANEYFRDRGAGRGHAEGELEFRFRSARDMRSDLCLLVETPERFRLKINGHAIRRRTERGWFRDPSLRMLVFTGGIRTGENLLRLVFRWKEGLELEPCYLLGRFGVRREGTEGFVVDGQPRTLHIGSWVEQGLPFYAGEVTYSFHKTFRKPPSDRAKIHFQGFRSALTVRVNGAEAGSLLWPPYELPVGHLLREGKNAFEITVVNSLRNFYGPHHLQGEDDVDCLGPHHFFEKHRMTKEYRFKPAGLLGEVYIEDSPSGEQ